MWASDYFQVIHGDVEAVGELTVTGNLPYGTWMQDFGDDVNAVTASGDTLGFLTQAVSLTGPTFEQMTVGFRNITAKSGTKVSIARLRSGDQIEVEDAVGLAASSTITDPATVTYPPTGGQGLLVTSGTGSLAGCAAGTDVSVYCGRLRVAQSGDIVQFKVINPNVTPIASDGGSGANIRLRLARVTGWKKP